MDWKSRITRDPDILFGKPAIRGTRIAVELILSFLANGWTEEDLLESYPIITKEDIKACLAYAAALVDAEKARPIAS